MSFSIVLATLCLSVFQLGYGQPVPTPPNLSESFTATMTRVGVGQELTAMLYRNYEEGLQRQVERLGSGKTVDGSVNIIVNVKEKMEYEYLEPYAYCSSVMSPGIRLQPQWAFVKEAKYKGAKTFNQMKVDVWTYNDTKTRIYYELGVSTETPKVPVFLFEDEGGMAFAVITFDSYTNGAPDASKFEVPAVCKEKESWFHRDTPSCNHSSISAFKNTVRLL